MNPHHLVAPPPDAESVGESFAGTAFKTPKGLVWVLSWYDPDHPASRIRMTSLPNANPADLVNEVRRRIGHPIAPRAA